MNKIGALHEHFEQLKNYITVVNLEYISSIEIGNNLILKWGAYLWVAPKLKFDCVILSTLF